jgi:ABC-type sugar transport system permease subunit
VESTAVQPEGVAVQLIDVSPAPPDPPPTPLRPRRTALQRRRGWVGLGMTAPAFLLVAAVLGWPMVQAGYYSLTQWDGLTTTWIGPSAYTHEFHDPAFWRVLQNNGLLLLSIPFALAIPLGIASLLDARVFGWRVFRIAYFMPTAISWVVIGLVAERFFAADGMLNSILGAVGLGAIRTDFLSGERTALLAVALTFVWSMIGTNTIIFLTGMATLDPALGEAARVDGASAWQRFARITVPQLKRFVQFALMMTLISAFTALFSLIFVMTEGGPGYGTTTLEFFVYQTAFATGKFGTGAMLGVILFAIMAAVGLLQVRLLRSRE